MFEFRFVRISTKISENLDTKKYPVPKSDLLLRGLTNLFGFRATTICL